MAGQKDKERHYHESGGDRESESLRGRDEHAKGSCLNQTRSIKSDERRPKDVLSTEARPQTRGHEVRSTALKTSSESSKSTSHSFKDKVISIRLGPARRFESGVGNSYPRPTNLRQLEMDEFCSMSTDRSRNDSSRVRTASQHMHRVSVARVPSKISWTHLPEHHRVTGEQDLTYGESDCL